MDRHVVALDLSKSSTGVCFAAVSPDGRFWVKDLFSIRIPQARMYSKLYHRAKDKTIAVFDQAMKEWGIAPQNTTITIEAPIFTGTQSELQFYLTESFLEWCDTHGFDVIMYSVTQVKSFIQHSSYTAGKLKKVKGKMDKEHIRRVYERYTFPINKWLPDPANVADDDQMDALYQALMGALFHVPFLTVGDLELPNTSESFFETLGDRLLLKSGDWYHCQLRAWSDRPYFPRWQMSPVEKVRVQYKRVWKNLLRVDHMSLKSPLFYPFAKVAQLERALKGYLEKEGKGFLQQFASLMGLGVRKTRNLFRGGLFQLGFTKKGGYFFEDL